MKRKKASEIFAAVDPHLKVIDGGTHHRHRSSENNWEKAGGLHCPKCGLEVVRLVDGLCIACWNGAEAEREEKAGRKAEKRALVRAFNEGRITLREMREGRL